MGFNISWPFRQRQEVCVVVVVVVVLVVVGASGAGCKLGFYLNILEKTKLNLVQKHVKT